TANLAGRRFEQVVVDVGFADGTLPVPDLVAGTDLLLFADLPLALLPVIPLSKHVAEKVHAYTRIYGATGRPSSRVKDLVDLVIVSGHAAFWAMDLHAALQATFHARDTQTLPVALPSPPADWRVPYR